MDGSDGEHHNEGAACETSQNWQGHGPENDLQVQIQTSCVEPLQQILNKFNESVGLLCLMRCSDFQIPHDMRATKQQ
jgi:hypothetical protein